MQRKVVMADTDERYIRKLAQVIRRKEQFPVALQVMTQKTFLMSYLENHMVDWVFASEHFIDEEIRARVGDRLTVLTEVKGGGWASEIYKYQSADALLKQMLEVFPERTSTANQDIFAVYPSDGGESSTVFGLALAWTLSGSGNVLYLNLDCFCPLWSFLPQPSGSSLSDWIFRYRQGMLSGLNQDHVFTWKGIDMIAPPSCPEDLEELGKLDFGDFLQSVAEERRYDWVICQFGEHPVQMGEILQVCRKVYLPTSSSTWKEARRRELVQYLVSVYGSDDTGKMIALSLPENRMQVPSEEEFSRIYVSEWRDFIWKHLQNDRIL